MKKAEEILRSILTTETMLINNPDYTYFNVLKAMELYAEYCCVEQKKLCLNKAKIDWFEIVNKDTDSVNEEHIETKSIICPDYSNDIFRINENSILNSPTYNENEKI